MRGGAGTVGWFPGLNYRMNEFTGGVLLAQIRKLDTIIAAVRTNAARVYAGVRSLRGVELRLLPDPAGELGTGASASRPRAARPLLGGDEGGRGPGFAAERIDYPSRGPGDQDLVRAQLAFLYLRARTLDPLRQGVLPAHDRDPGRFAGVMMEPGTAEPTQPMQPRLSARCIRP